MKTHYDAVIIGGGIQGVGCAQALAANGYSVLLLEKSSLGAGTSSRSSKLIHGGLRYLETGQFSLVRKSLHERMLLAQLAPDLVKHHHFYIPVYRNWRLKPWKLTIGLLLYALLGNFSRSARFNRLPKDRWQLLDGLRQDKLIAVFRYSDAQTDDLRLTQAVAESAQSLGAMILEQHQLLNVSRTQDHTFKVHFRASTITDQPDDQSSILTVNASLVINAAGPWVDEVQRRIDIPMTTPDIALVKGSHIEFDQCLSDKFFYVESPDDQRAVFIMPWKDGTLVGTTEQAHSGNPDQQQPSEREIAYLMRTIKHYFPEFNAPISRQWSGLRVLPRPKSSNGTRVFSKQARDTMIVTDNRAHPRVISLYGGKLTAYRVTAEKILRIAEKTLPPKGHRVDTSTIPLKLPRDQ